jgi:methionyl-tRNA formyltransferase
MSRPPIKFVFFGGEPLAVPVLEELQTNGLLPQLIVCNPDRPVGRKQTLTPPPAKIWAAANEIEVYQPTSYKDQSAHTRLTDEQWDVFVVVAYNFILPSWLLALPTHGAINLHPSLLPQLRGASPIRSAILRDERTAVGVSVMLLDAEMDHGPILAQQPMPITDEYWPLAGPGLDQALAYMGGALLAETLPKYIAGDITPTEQDHAKATYCGKLGKADAELFIDPTALPTGESAYNVLLKIKAFIGIGDTFFIYQNKRVKVHDAKLTLAGELDILTVTPEGKRQMDFDQYLNGIN